VTPPRPTQEELLELRLAAEASLMRYEGVFGVGLGLKERGGEVTDEVAFRVYVREKKELARLAPAQVLPREYGGVPTDVLEMRRNVPNRCEDVRQHSPLAGGITISTMKADAGGHVGVGTLGFHATIDGATPPENIALVTNHHVISDAGAGKGDTVYQPEWAQQPSGAFGVLLGKGSAIGTVLGLPDKRDYPDNPSGFFVDAASVALNICVSSWCDTNCGVSFAPGVLGLDLPRSNVDLALTNAIADVATARQGDVVVKVGRSTGRTVGVVTEVALPVENPGGVIVHNNIEILATRMSTPDNCGGTLRFSDVGDSGAALVDGQRRLVGLVHGSNPVDTRRSHACHIQPVLAQLKVTPITEANPLHDHPAASTVLARAPAIIDGKSNQTPFLRERFLASGEGQRIAALVETHRLEVVHLVNHCRRVTVAWHRGRGPAFLNRALANAADPETSIPRSIDGVTREALLLAMERSLLENGSPALRAALQAHRDEVVPYVDAFDSLHDLVESLEERQAV
jgi:hypothetical protein